MPLRGMQEVTIGGVDRVIECQKSQRTFDLREKFAVLFAFISQIVLRKLKRILDSRLSDQLNRLLLLQDDKPKQRAITASIKLTSIISVSNAI